MINWGILKFLRFYLNNNNKNDSNRAAIQSNRKELWRGVQNERLKGRREWEQGNWYCKITFLGDGRGSIRLPNSEVPSLWDLMPDDLIWGGPDVLIIQIKYTISVTHFNYPETVSFPSSPGGLGGEVFHKTGPGCQKRMGTADLTSADQMMPDWLESQNYNCLGWVSGA